MREDLPETVAERLNESAREVGENAAERLPDSVLEVVRALLGGGGE